MCGIFGLIVRKPITNNKYKKYTLECINKLQHRGPDGTGYYENKNICLGHKRLAIIDPKKGSQPIISNDGNLVLCVNGEIFNYKDLRKEYSTYNYNTNSDCESINALYNYYNNTNNTNKILNHTQIVSLLEQLDGQFSFILYDKINNMVLIARDPFGITQLYYGLDSNGNIHFSSELKALTKCVNVSVFPSGNYMYLNTNDTKLNQISYFSDTKNGSWLKPSKEQIEENYFSKEQYFYSPQPLLDSDEQQILMAKIKETFENAVIKRLMSDVPFGILLSGGLDSSLVASVAVKYIRSHPEKYGENPIIHTFSIGDKDSTDLPYAKKVADFLNTTHHEISFTVEDGMNAIENVIYHLETYDITTIRASTPHYLLAQKIQSMGIKMVLSGEGSDELLGGYLYFHKAPSDEEHQIECKKRVMDLGYFDCLRADKSTMAHSVEARYPFLDTEFIKLCINIHKDVKTQKSIEKYILRAAFAAFGKSRAKTLEGLKPLSSDEVSNQRMEKNEVDVEGDSSKIIKNVSQISRELEGLKPSQPSLPDEILWRQKEQFSDSITYRWIDTLKADTEKQVIDKSLVAYNHRELIYPYNTPQTHEAFYYRQIFEKLFPNREKTVKCWYPNTRWKGITSSDPSGRAQTCHINTNTNTNQ
jgi:asparagine synthase (glutamine-hydrolysing)